MTDLPYDTVLLSFFFYFLCPSCLAATLLAHGSSASGLPYCLLARCCPPAARNLTQSHADLSTGSFPACDILNYLLLMCSGLVEEVRRSDRGLIRGLTLASYCFLRALFDTFLTISIPPCYCPKSLLGLCFSGTYWQAERTMHCTRTGSDATKRGHTDHEPYIWCSNGERFVADLLSCIGGDHVTERTFDT